MNDQGLNNVLSQYFTTMPSTTFEKSQVIPGAKPAHVSQGDVEQRLAEMYDAGQLDSYDLTATIFNYVLPRGTILNDNPKVGARAGTHPTRHAGNIESEAADSRHGLGGYHGSIHRSSKTLYYAVGVYSEHTTAGDNGIPVFDQPWKNVVATFYHELCEARTDPDVADAIAQNSNRPLAWTSSQGEEIGDYPIFEANPITLVFQEVALRGGTGTAPVQLMYSNRVHRARGSTRHQVPLPVGRTPASQEVASQEGASQEVDREAKSNGPIAQRAGALPRTEPCEHRNGSPLTSMARLPKEIALTDTPRVSVPEGKKADLVLEGGGVKGIGLVGAVLTLHDAGYQFPRVAGTSAGAITAALVAALQAAGKPLTLLAEYVNSVDYRKFQAEGWLQHTLGRVGDAGELLLHMGLHSGDYLVEWLGGILDQIGITTFEQLRMDDPGSSLPDDLRYSLIVHTADITRRKVVRLPWDYGNYGLDPDRERIVDAVRASMSIPFFFEPVRVKAPASTYGGVTYSAGSVTWVDGGLLSNFPVEVFDRSDGQPQRWPTIGIKLSAAIRPCPRRTQATTRSTKQSIASKRCSTTLTVTTSRPTKSHGRSSSTQPVSLPPTSTSHPNNAPRCSTTDSTPHHSG